MARVPRISVIQAEGANPLVRSLAESHGASLEPVEAHTRATAIRIGNPASWRKAARVVQDTGGWCLDVTEAEIAIAKAELGAEGLGCEPASAVTLAGLKKLRAQGHPWQRGDRGAGAHRAHAEGRRLHHRFSSRHPAARMKRRRDTKRRSKRLRRNAISVEATPEAVLAAVKDQRMMGADMAGERRAHPAAAARDFGQPWRGFRCGRGGARFLPRRGGRASAGVLNSRNRARCGALLATRRQSHSWASIAGCSEENGRPVDAARHSHGQRHSAGDGLRLVGRRDGWRPSRWRSISAGSAGATSRSWKRPPRWKAIPIMPPPAGWADSSAPPPRDEGCTLRGWCLRPSGGPSSFCPPSLWPTSKARAVLPADLPARGRDCKSAVRRACWGWRSRRAAATCSAWP